MVESQITRVGLVAGEKSGDALGAGLISQLRNMLPTAEFSGLGGQAMQGAGLNSIADMERLSVMGFIEPLKRLPDLFALRRDLYQHFIDWQADVVIGIDSPDFNLGLERKLKQAGILSCHYVCPSVWAWRQGRVKKIRRSVDHVLTLLPFEQEFLQKHHIASTFVGHPLADRLAPRDGLSDTHCDSSDTGQARLGLCVMPGSRHSEVVLLAPVFMQVAKHILEVYPNLTVSIPAASESLYKLLEQTALEVRMGSDRFTIERCFKQQQSLDMMAASDLILLASGTATLEAALLGKPMVVAYKMSAFTYMLARWLVKLESVSLPNLLLEEPLIPEFIQGQATVDNLFASVRQFIDNPEARKSLSQSLSGLSAQLACNADQRAAAAVVRLLGHDADG